MARITVEDCLRQVESRFSLVVLGAKRAKMLIKGAPALVQSDNKYIVNALREIAAGKVYYAHPDNLKRVKAEFKSIPDETEFIGDDEYIE